MLINLLSNYPYFFSLLIMLIGIAIILYSNNLIKKVIGLNVFQTSVILFYISMSKVTNGTIPKFDHTNKDIIYANPLPQVLMLTAIVVGIATTSVAFALIIKIKKNYTSVSEDLINNDL